MRLASSDRRDPFVPLRYFLGMRVFLSFAGPLFFRFLIRYSLDNGHLCLH